MKKIAAKFLSLLLVLSFVLTAFPLSVTANETAVITEENEKEEIDYTDLYVRDVDGIEGDELVFLYDAFGKTAEDGAPTSITDHLGNTVKLPAGASYKDNALYLGGKALNLSSLYDKTKDIHFETVIEQTGEVVNNSSKFTYIGPYSVQISTATPVDESHGVVSGFYWLGANWGTDVSWNHNCFIGEYVGKVYSVGFAIRKTLTAEEPTYNVTYSRNAAYYTDKVSVTTAPSKEVAYTASSDNSVSFGSNFCVNYYAVRLYNMPLSEAQMRQNHLADLMGFFGVPTAAYLALPEDARQAVNNGAVAISLSDENGADALNALIENALHQSLYVSDVDGDGESDISFFYDAFGKKAGDAVGTSIVDNLGNVLTIPSGASYDDNALYLRGGKLDLTPVYDAQKSLYLDLVIEQTGERVGQSAQSFIGPTGAISIGTNQGATADTHPIDESYGVVSGSYWIAGGWGVDVSWSPTRFLGNYIGDIYTIGYAVDQDTKAGTYKLSYVRDGAVVKGPSNSIAVNSSPKINFGEGFCVNYYAIRLYTEVLSADQIAQNHFADLMNFFHLPLDNYLALSEDARKAIIDASAAISLSDEDGKEKVLSLIEQAYRFELVSSLYVQDHLVFMWDGFGETDSNASAAKLTLHNRLGDGKSVTLSGATAKDGYLSSNGVLDYSSLITKDENGDYNDFSFDLTIAQAGATDSTLADKGTNHRAYTNFALGPIVFGNGTLPALDAFDSHGVLNGKYQAFRYNKTVYTTYYFETAENGGALIGTAAPSTGTEGVDYVSVAIPYLPKQSENAARGQISLDSTWGDMPRYLGNYVGESYTVGASVKFTVEDVENGYGSMEFNVIRDGITDTCAEGGAWSQLMYARGKNYEHVSAAVNIVPANLTEALDMADNHPAANLAPTYQASGATKNAWNADKGVFSFGVQNSAATLNYYTFRVYDDILTADEYKQNHFVDLLYYHEVDVDLLEAFASLEEDEKTALYERFSEASLGARKKTTYNKEAGIKDNDGDVITEWYDETEAPYNTSFEDVTRADLEAAILKASYGISAEDFISFVGYQARLYGTDPGLRSLYALADTFPTVENVEVKEIGAIMAIADGRTVDDLTVSVAGTQGAKMQKAAIYENGALLEKHVFNRDVDGVTKACFAYTTYFASASQTKTNFETELLYRGYVTVTIGNRDYTLYTDMTDSLETISMESVTNACVEASPALAETSELIKLVLTATADEAVAD